MNERIKSLWDQSKSSGVHPEFGEYDMYSAGKFAQLIVQDMCDMMRQEQDSITNQDASEVSWGYVSQLDSWIERFEQHFGVEE